MVVKQKKAADTATDRAARLRSALLGGSAFVPPPGPSPAWALACRSRPLEPVVSTPYSVPLGFYADEQTYEVFSGHMDVNVIITRRGGRITVPSLAPNFTTKDFVIFYLHESQKHFGLVVWHSVRYCTKPTRPPCATNRSDFCAPSYNVPAGDAFAAAVGPPCRRDQSGSDGTLCQGA